MKKYLPLILLFAGILLFIGVFFFVKNQKSPKSPEGDDESALIDVPLPERPVVSLTPTADGHYVKLKVEKIIIKNAKTIECIVDYQTDADITQRVPCSGELDGQKTFETEILFGTESSGKFRYDEGVETGSVDVMFRNNEGKLIAKFNTDFHLQTGTTELSSLDGKFKFTLEKDAKGVFFVTMPTVGIPEDSFKSVAYKDGYAVFASDEGEYSGTSNTE